MKKTIGKGKRGDERKESGMGMVGSEELILVVVVGGNCFQFSFKQQLSFDQEKF